VSDVTPAFVQPPPERYVDRRELAVIMGVHVNTIDRMVSEGMPSETWGRRTRRFLPSKAITWAQAQAPQRSAAA
jgi:phage terminase Nu1 subunit (DNA packaging protein)